LAPASLRSTVTFVDGGEVQFAQRWACATAQGAIVNHTYSRGLHSAESAVAQVTVYQPHAFDPSQAEQGKAVTVQGHGGYFGPIDNPNVLPFCSERGTQLTCRPLGPAKQSPALVWEYAKDAWAVVQQSYYNTVPEASQPDWGATLPQLLQVADGVSTNTSTPLLVPFRIGYLPDDLTVMGASSPGPTDLGLEADAPELGLVLPDSRGGPPGCAGVDCADLIVSAYPGGSQVAQHHVALKVAGHPARYYPPGPPGTVYNPSLPRLEVDLDGWRVQLRVAPSAEQRIGRDDLVRIAQTITVADASPLTTSSWFDAATVVPR
jgi:hypothetical protein